MALKMNYPKTVVYISSSNIIGITERIEQEIIIKNAYVKIGNIQGVKEITFSLEIYQDETKQNLMCVDKKSEYRFNIDLLKSENHIVQAYEHLKTLPEFAGAVDA